VVTPGGTATSSSAYTVTVVTPSISSFTPANGPVGTVVTITGSNFSGATAVTFNGMSAAFTINSSTQITATVPANASTGPVRVTTPSGTATGPSNFVVTVTKHRRAISLHVGRHLRAHGQVSVQFGFSSCADNVPVKIQKRRPGSWHTETRVLTNAFGAYRVRLFGHGTYRAVASRLVIGSDVCRQAASGRVTISRRF
jgi:hypothetical protein